jgi:hypothetical protein
MTTVAPTGAGQARNNFAMTGYPLPLRDPADPGRPPAPVALDVPRPDLPGDGRRLAIIDTHFPWRISGFRFFEFRKMLRRRPDTVFFSLYTSDEPFDVPVHPLADVPVLAPALGVTDVYGVFLNFTVGVLGMTGQFPIPGSRPTSRWSRRCDTTGCASTATSTRAGG